MDEKKVDIVDLISNLLDSGKCKEALSVPNDEKHVEHVKDNCWDLISSIIGKIDNQTAVTKPSLQRTCEELISIVVQKATPEEALLELIEQIEVAKNDAQFSTLLIPLQKLLKKLSIKRGRSLEWCLNSISTYIESIPIPEHQLEGKERLLLDCDPNIRRIITVYSVLPHFYEPFVSEVTTPNANLRTKQIITAFLVSLLGKPLIYLDLDPEVNQHGEAKQTCSTIIQDICICEKNIFNFRKYLEKYSKQKGEDKKYDNMKGELEPYDQIEKINMTSLSGLFYGVYSGHFIIPQLLVPQIYSTEFIVQTLMLAAVHLLQFSEFGPVSKGICLTQVLLNRLGENISSIQLSNSINYEFCKSLVNNAIYSSYETTRKKCVLAVECFINKFEFKGRCMLIRYIVDTCNHSGMIGFVITLYKNSLNNAFCTGDLPDCFVGAQLSNMIKKFCHLPHGSESDIVELGDQIVSALNFLRYLVLRDSSNLTGIKDNFSFIESKYLDKLRVALNMSKAHYEVKLKDIEEDKNDLEVSINIGGNVLDNIPKQQKKDIIYSALNAFHLIESLTARLSECIHLNSI